MKIPIQTSFFRVGLPRPTRLLSGSPGRTPRFSGRGAMSWNLFDKTSHDEEEVEQALHAAKHQKHAEFGPQPSNGCCILLYRCVAHHCDRARLCCGECLEHLIPRKWCGARAP